MKIEGVAVGQPIDHNKDPTTPEIVAPEHPEALTENTLREELNRKLRPRYTFCSFQSKKSRTAQSYSMLCTVLFF